MAKLQHYEWSICVTTSREKLAVLTKSINSLLIACHEKHCKLNILVNGNYDLAESMAEKLRSAQLAVPENVAIFLYHIELGDKPNALNVYFHKIRDSADFYFLTDGYVQVDSQAMELLANGLKNDPKKLAASGIPMSGRDSKRHAQRILRFPGLHGNLLVLKHETAQKLRNSRFHWMLRMYRTDGYLSSAVCFDFDPVNNEYDHGKVMVDPAAYWTFRPLSFFSFEDIKSGIQRWFRQSRGHIINDVLRYHFLVEKLPLESFPETIGELVKMYYHKNRPIVDKQRRRNVRYRAAFDSLAEEKASTTTSRDALLAYATGRSSESNAASDNSPISE